MSTISQSHFAQTTYRPVLGLSVKLSSREGHTAKKVRPSMQGVYYVGNQDDGFAQFEFSTTASGGSGTPSTETSPQSSLRPPPTASNQSLSSQLPVCLVHMNAWTFYISGKQRNDWRRTVRFVVPQRI